MEPHSQPDFPRRRGGGLGSPHRRFAPTASFDAPGARAGDRPWLRGWLSGADPVLGFGHSVRSDRSGPAQGCIPERSSENNRRTGTHPHRSHRGGATPPSIAHHGPSPRAVAKIAGPCRPAARPRRHMLVPEGRQRWCGIDRRRRRVAHAGGQHPQPNRLWRLHPPDHRSQPRRKFRFRPRSPNRPQARCGRAS